MFVFRDPRVRHFLLTIVDDWVALKVALRIDAFKDQTAILQSAVLILVKCIDWAAVKHVIKLSAVLVIEFFAQLHLDTWVIEKFLDDCSVAFDGYPLEFARIVIVVIIEANWETL